MLCTITLLSCRQRYPIRLDVTYTSMHYPSPMYFYATLSSLHVLDSHRLYHLQSLRIRVLFSKSLSILIQRSRQSIYPWFPWFPVTGLHSSQMYYYSLSSLSNLLDSSRALIPRTYLYQLPQLANLSISFHHWNLSIDVLVNTPLSLQIFGLRCGLSLLYTSSCSFV